MARLFFILKYLTTRPGFIAADMADVLTIARATASLHLKVACIF